MNVSLPWLIILLLAILGLGWLVLHLTRRNRAQLTAARTAAAESASLYRTLVETARHAYVAIDAQGEVTAWNAAAERMFGFAREEAVGSDLAELIIPPRHREALRRDLDQRARGAADPAPMGTREVTALGRDRGEFLIQLSLSVVEQDGGPTVHAFIEDLSVPQAAEADRQLLSDVIHSTHDAVITTDRSGRITSWNHRAERLYGYGESAILGHRVSELSPSPEEREQAEALLERVLAGESVNLRSVRRRQADGHAVEIALSASPLHETGGAVVGTADISRDVTSELRREREIHRLATIVEQSGEAITTKDATGRILEWNPAAERLYGYSAEEAVGQSVSMLVPPERQGEEMELLRRALAGETTRQFETRRVRKDGAVLDVSITVAPLRDEAGVPCGASIVTRDVSARVRAEHERERALGELRESEQRFRSTLEHAPIGMALVGLDGHFIQINRALCEIVGHDEEELWGLTFEEITHPDDREADREQLSRLLAGETTSYRMQKRYRHKLDYVVWVELRVSLLRDEDGAPVHFIYQVQDITAQRATMEALQASERRFGSIAANIPGMVYRLAVSPRGRVSLPFVSAGAREIYGREPRELIRHPALLVSGIHPEDQERWDRCAAEAAATMSRLEWRGRMTMPDGTTRYLHRIAQPWREPDGTLVWDGVVLDESARHASEEQEAETRQRLELVLQNLAGSAITLYDRELRLRFCEGPLFADTDLQRMIGRPVTEFTSARLQSLLLPGIEKALAGDFYTTILDADNQQRTLALYLAPYRLADGTIDGALVHWQDISALRTAQRERDEALERFQVAFDRAPIGMGIVDLQGRFQRVNEALCGITGYSAVELLAMKAISLVLADEVPQVRRELTELTSTDTLVLEHRILHAAGHPVWINLRATVIRSEDGEPLHVLAQVQDVSERRRYEDRLRHMADHDPLTGLLNRRGLEPALEHQLARVRRYGSHGALLVLDLDGFKFVNDTLGHAVGDELIISCAGALTSRLRETDVVARLGGDEFAVLLPDQTEAETIVVAQALLSVIREKTAGFSGAYLGRVTASIGIAPFSDGKSTADEMLVNADLAMYDAKDAGKDRYALYSPQGHGVPKIKAQVTWLERIQRALEEDRFVLYAQPIIDLRTRRVVQHEVLVRMMGEDGDLIPPATFLDIAERFGIIHDLDRWVLSHAIRTMGEHHRRGLSLPLAVNISGASTGDPDVLSTIIDELRGSEVDPGELTLEITETAAVADIPRASRFAEALSDAGCRFALDDFGAGFGSFYYLKHLRFDVLKIDGEFVRRATDNPADRLVIKAISDIARGLGKQTVAEFVPGEEAIRLLLEHGVDLGQGYYLGRPQPLESVAPNGGQPVARMFIHPAEGE